MGGALLALLIGFFIASLLRNGLRGGAGDPLGVDEGLVAREMGGVAAGERSLACDWKMSERLTNCPIQQFAFVKPWSGAQIKMSCGVLLTV